MRGVLFFACVLAALGWLMWWFKPQDCTTSDAEADQLRTENVRLDSLFAAEQLQDSLYRHFTDSMIDVLTVQSGQWRRAYAESQDAAGRYLESGRLRPSQNEREALQRLQAEAARFDSVFAVIDSLVYATSNPLRHEDTTGNTVPNPFPRVGN